MYNSEYRFNTLGWSICCGEQGKIKVWGKSKFMSSGIISKLGGSEGIAIDVHRTYNVIDL
jgi:hypothetical protein